MKNLFILCTSLLTLWSFGQQKLESVLIENYDGNSYTNNYGINYEYNTNGITTSTTNFLWDGTAWQKSGKHTYAYHANGKLEEIVVLNWDGTKFVNFSRDFYTYSSSGKVESMLDQLWDNGEWQNSGLSNSAIYDGNHLIEFVTNSWENDQWIPTIKSSFSYDEKGNVTEIIYTEREGMTWSSHGNARYTYAYDDNHNIINYKFYVRDSSSWKEFHSIDYVYDAAGNLLSSTMYEFGMPKEKNEYAYDMSDYMKNYITPFDDPTSVLNLPSPTSNANKILSNTTYTYNNTSSKFEESSKTTYNYKSKLLNTQNVSLLEDFAIVPNPAKEYIRLQGLKKRSTIFIYNTEGKLLLKEQVLPNAIINLKGLSSGVYYIQTEGFKTQKFIKK